MRIDSKIFRAPSALRASVVPAPRRLPRVLPPVASLGWRQRFAIVALVLAAVGCGEQFSTQEAYDACEDLLARQSQATGDEEFAACVACYEDCGIDCTQTAEAPVTFECPEE